MKTDYIPTEEKPTLPKVGECYCHKSCDSPNIYLRIPDENGRQIFPYAESDVIFSVCLATGSLAHTYKSCFESDGNGIILEQIEPAKFTNA